MARGRWKETAVVTHVGWEDVDDVVDDIGVCNFVHVDDDLVDVDVVDGHVLLDDCLLH